MKKSAAMEEVQRFLRGPRDAERELDVCLERVCRCRALAERTTGRLGRERVQEQSAGSRVELYACELEELQRAAEAAREQAQRLRRRQEEVLAGLEDQRLRELLRLYYQCDFTWEETAERMGYSQRQVMRLRQQAMAAVQKVLQEGRECHMAS